MHSATARMVVRQSETSSHARGACICGLWLPTCMCKEVAQHNAHFFGTGFDKSVRRLYPPQKILMVSVL